jgi:hypothetical protein
MELAQRLEIHPAIVAGRVPHETRNYRLLTHFVGTELEAGGAAKGVLAPFLRMAQADY